MALDSRTIRQARLMQTATPSRGLLLLTAWTAEGSFPNHRSWEVSSDAIDGFVYIKLREGEHGVQRTITREAIVTASFDIFAQTIKDLIQELERAQQ